MCAVSHVGALNNTRPRMAMTWQLRHVCDPRHVMVSPWRQFKRDEWVISYSTQFSAIAKPTFTMDIAIHVACVTSLVSKSIAILKHLSGVDDLAV